MHLPLTQWPKVKPSRPLLSLKMQQQTEHPPQKVKVKRESDNIALKIVDEYAYRVVINCRSHCLGIHCFASQRWI